MYKENTAVHTALEKLQSAPPSDRIGFIAIIFEHWSEAFFHADGYKNEYDAYKAGHPYFLPGHAGIENSTDIAFACLAVYETLTTPRFNSTPDVAEASINETPELDVIRTAFYKLNFADKKRFLVGVFGKMQSGQLFEGMEMPSGGLGLGYKNAVSLLEYMREQGDIDESEYKNTLAALDDSMPF